MFGARDEQSAREARALYQQAQSIYKSEPEPPCVPVDMAFSARQGQPVSLRVRDADGFEYQSQALPAETARTRATTSDEVESGLRKTGGTVFDARDVAVELDDGLRVPMSAVNALRRRCLEGLEAVRQKAPERRTGVWEPGLHRGGHEGRPGYIFSFVRLDQVTPRLLDMGPDYLYLPLRELDRHGDVVRALTRKGQKIGAVLDRVTFDSEWPGQIELLRRVKDAGVSALVCGNLAHPALLSGLGFELTLKLKKDGIRKRDKEYKNICGILQTLARMSFEDGDIFSPEEYIYTGQTTGIDADGSSQITGFLTTEDKLGTIDTPNGKVQFVQLVGATDAELKALVEDKTTVSALLEKLPDGLTDYTRDCIL